VASLLAAGLATGGTVVVAADQAEAAPRSTAQRSTGYSLEGTAYGTRVTTGTGLASGRSAFSHVSCTQLAGKVHRAELASLALPSDSPVVEVGTVTSTTRTFTAKDRGIAAGVESVNRIGDVHFGGNGAPLLSFTGLRTTSTAWATTDGALRTSNDFSAGDIRLTGLDVVPKGPLRDLTNALDRGIDAVLDTVTDNGGTIAIPGLGEVSVGYDKQVHRAGTAFAGAFVLQVTVYAGNLKVGLGRSYARITRGDVAGVLNGLGWGASGEVLDGTLTIGGLGEEPLPCQGTGGKVTSSAAAGLELGGAGPELGVVRGRVSGRFRPNGSAQAWTEGSIASISVGGLEISGITGRVNLGQDRRGRIVRNDFAGSAIGGITFNGTSYGSFDPATAGRIPALEVPGVAAIEFFKREKRKRGSRISAVVITLLDGTATTQLRLGNARASITK
jgi:hypothetical protein